MIAAIVTKEASMQAWSEGALQARHAQLAQRAHRAGLSRGELVRRGAAVAGGLAGLGLLHPAAALGASPSSDPRPIPGGFDSSFTPVPSNPLIHVLPPAVGFDMSTITDFRGVVAAAEIQGTAAGSDGTTYSFDADMRFMQGMFVGLDGRVRKGSFGFV
jgi:hypothetical protein